MVVMVHTLGPGWIGIRYASFENRSFMYILRFLSNALRSSLGKLFPRGILSLHVNRRFPTAPILQKQRYSVMHKRTLDFRVIQEWNTLLIIYL